VPNPDTHTGIACPPLSGPSFFGWQHRSACTWLLLPYTFEHLRNACGKCQPLTAFVTVTSLRELCALEKIYHSFKASKISENTFRNNIIAYIFAPINLKPSYKINN